MSPVVTALAAGKIRVGNTAVSKIMRGTAQIWPTGAAPPALIDSFTALANTSNAITKDFIIPAGKTIPAGVLLAVGWTLNSNSTAVTTTDNSDNAGTANTYARRTALTLINGTNNFGGISLCKTTRSIDPGDFIRLQFGSSRNRAAAVVAWFSGTFPDTAIDGDSPDDAGSSAAWSTSAQLTPAAGPTLDLALPIGTGAVAPYTFGGGFTKIGEATTAAGSSDRGCAMGYRISPAAGARSAAGTCGDAAWGAGLIALDYTP